MAFGLLDDVINVSIYDTNAGVWRHEQFSTDKRIGPVVALNWLCANNERNQEDGTPCGPLRYHGNTKQFVLVAAWTIGHEWFEVFIVFSQDQLSDAELATILDLEGVEREDEDEGG